MPATPVHHTETDDGTWDGPAQEKKLETPLTKAIGDDAYAWVDPKGDETTKTAWRFIHHFVAGSGDPGSASTMACSTGIGVLNGARTGTTIPAADRAGVHAHLAAHLSDAGVKDADIPELKSAPQLETLADDDEAPCPTCDGSGTIMDGNRKCPDCNGTGVEQKSAPSLELRHDTFTGTHSHAHSAMGNQGGDVTHDHEHSHDNDSSHAHAEAKSRLPATAIRADYRGSREERVSTGPKFELREIPNGTGGTNLRFTGFASVTGDTAAYEMEDWLGSWVESVNVGAFGKTISEGCDTAFLLNHTGMTLARTKPGTLKLAEETDPARSSIFGITGLHSEAMLDPQNFYVQAMRSAVEREDLDEMSFAFRVLRQEWNDDYTRRWINEVTLHQGDVSLVNYGANPTTAGTVSMRQKLNARREPMDVRRLCVKLMEIRAGATLSSATLSNLQGILDRIDAADTNVDQALIDLSSLMGVPNPDVEQDAELDRGCGCCADCTDDCDGSCCDDCSMGQQQNSAGLFPQFFQTNGAKARAQLEALRYAPERVAE